MYGYNVTFQKGFLQLSHEHGQCTLILSCSYPELLGFRPLKIAFNWVRVTYRDDSFSGEQFDYSNCRMPIPRSHPWVEAVGSWLLKTLDPRVRFCECEARYVYQSRIGVHSTTLVRLSGVETKASRGTVTSSASELVISEQSEEEKGIERTIFHGECMDESTWELRSYCEVDFLADSLSFKVCVASNLSGIVGLFSEQPWPSSLAVISPSACQVKVNIVVRKKVKVAPFVQDNSVSVLSEIDMGGGSSSRTALTGLFISVVFDPFSLNVASLTVHNVCHSRGGGVKQVSAQLVVRGGHVMNLVLLNSTLIGNYEGKNSWSFSGRTQSLKGSLFDPTGSDTLFEMTSGSLAGSDSKGISMSMNLFEIDASARMLSKVARLYVKLASFIESSDSGAFMSLSSSSSTPPLSRQSTPMIFSVSDPNYFLMQQKYFKSSLSSPEETAVAPWKGPGKDSESNSMKNWRALERVKFDAKKPVVSVCIDKIIVSNKNLLTATLNKVKMTGKISSMGSPFSTVCLEGCSVNENLLMNEGLRIWIDGNLSSDFSRVFCLVPPITITFDPQFAALVERYLLDLVEVVKLISTRSSPEVSATKFIEFLQISSLQLELHAKEMLGVLALDKAIIHLTRLSVYRSNGVVEALNSLAHQYREELVGQWLSLLMRLDVSIGRPVSTARKLMSGLTDLFMKDKKNSSD